jgi:S1-C subfamily serine protease
MPTPFDQDSYPSSPPTAPHWSTPSDDLGGPTAPTAEQPAWAPPTPTTQATAPRLSRLVVAAVVTVALLAGSVAGGTAAWFAFARSGSSTTPARSEVASPGTGSEGSSASGTQAESLAGWDEVSAAVNPGVVDIESQVAGGIGAGTGMVLTSDGRILTNNHVVEDALSIVVTIATTGETYRAQIVGADPAEDVAVLQLEGAEDLATVPLGDSDELAVGDLVAAIGNAGGVGGEPSIAAGRVTALGQEITATAEDGGDAQTLDDMIQVAANVVPGDSGGPLADDRGTVVGMTTAASVGNGTGRLRAFGGSTAGVGYAIPIDRALEIVDEIVATGGSTSSTSGTGGYLGVQVTTSPTGGVEIAGVMSGSPAAAAGIEIGDTIVSLDDAQVDAPDELVELLAGLEAGDEVTVTWFGSDGRAHQAEVTLSGR